jgi:hypothetical protein
MTDAMDIPVGGGELSLQSALFSVGRVHIEENTGEEGGEKGGGEKNGEGGEGEGGKGEGGKGEGGEGENEDDIDIDGPFAIDIATGGAVLQSVAVFPGTFRKVELTLHLETQAPFNGDSIVVSGQFQPSVGAAIPFTLRSHVVLDEMEVPIANGGVTVSSNTQVAFALTFDLAAMFAGMDMQSAVVEGGEITVDATHNTALLAIFEDNLRNSIEAEEDDG